MPVRHFITRFFDFMAAALVMFVRHGVKSIGVLILRGCHITDFNAEKLIYSTTLRISLLEMPDSSYNKKIRISNLCSAGFCLVTQQDLKEKLLSFSENRPYI